MQLNKAKATTNATKARATKAKAAQASAPAVAENKPAKAPLVHFHRESGLASSLTYAGPSKTVNGNRKTAIKLSAYARTVAQLTPRTLDNFRASRAKYGKQAFPARGIDNAVAAMLINAGLFEHVAGSGQTHTFADGHTGIIDGQTPAMLQISKAGHDYGNGKA